MADNQINLLASRDTHSDRSTNSSSSGSYNNNRFSTGGTLTTSDLHNSANYEGQAIGVNVNTGQQDGKHVVNGVGAGVGQDSGSAQSTTTAGISGIAGDQSVRTGDATGIERIFDQNKVQREIHAQVAITAEFGKQASKAVGDYAEAQMKVAEQLRTQGKQAEADAIKALWGDNGSLRLAAHTVIGGLTGGVSGAAGAATGTLTAPAVAHALHEAGITGPLADVLTAGASTAAGAATGGVSGAAAAGNEVENNYLKHTERTALANAQKACFADASSPACANATALKIKDQLSDKLLSNATASRQGTDCNTVVKFIQNQLGELGCTGPSACPDFNTLDGYLRVAQEKVQGLEPVYPEGWLLDAKAVFDLGKFGVNLVSRSVGSRGSLDALKQLANTDATTVSNNVYCDGAIPKYWTNGKPGDGSLNLVAHWEKHSAEFPNFNSANDYYRGATDFVTMPPPGTLVKKAPNGDVLLYHPATNTFGVRTADGLPRTMFKPEPSQHGYATNIEFWNAK